MSAFLRHKWTNLLGLLEGYGNILVAFSGGCDSTFLAAAARKRGKEHVLAVTAVSASLASSENEAVRKLSMLLDIEHTFIATQEIQNPQYAANPPNRCYFCKDELFSKLAPLAQARGMVVLDGFNASDRAEDRPGYQASQQWNIQHPLNDAGLTKHDIRVLSRWMKLPTWNKPASPCLSSRIPFGISVTADNLRQIEYAEAFLKTESFSVVRVRHFNDLARIEVPLRDIPRLQEESRWVRIVAEFQRLGYRKVETDPRGFKSGRLQEEISSKIH
jgi:uncharacterized protein